MGPVVNHEFLGAVLARRVRVSEEQHNTVSSVVKVRHMFGDSTETVSGETLNYKPVSVKKNIPVVAVALPVVALSKLIEYPGDPVRMSTYLTNDTVSIHGRDMFGLTALHKVASWDKVDLLDMLLLHTSTDDVLINAPSGSADGFTPLHMCVDSGACATAMRLLADSRVDLSTTDKLGRTALALAEQQQKTVMIDMLNAAR
eukprot:gene24026-30322_t